MGLTNWVSALKEWIDDQAREVNKELDEAGDSISALETDNFVLKTTLDEAFSSLIILKDQMKIILPFWCEKCRTNFEEPREFKVHQRMHRKTKLTLEI